MVDGSVVSRMDRSALMASIRGKDTRPEMTVRRLVHRLGYRYRLHRRDLPGSPDLVFPSRRRVIFVHGCFWHRHDCPLGKKTPRVRPEYWLPKLARNHERDIAVRDRLCQLGWETLVIWECELRRLPASSLKRKISAFLDR